MPSLDPDATVPDAGIASVPLRRIRAVEPREEFLYELSAGRGRHWHPGHHDASVAHTDSFYRELAERLGQ